MPLAATRGGLAGGRGQFRHYAGASHAVRMNGWCWVDTAPFFVASFQAFQDVS